MGGVHAEECVHEQYVVRFMPSATEHQAATLFSSAGARRDDAAAPTFRTRNRPRYFPIFVMDDTIAVWSRCPEGTCRGKSWRVHLCFASLRAHVLVCAAQQRAFHTSSFGVPSSGTLCQAPPAPHRIRTAGGMMRGGSGGLRM